jgi:hypothetical protein
MPPSFVVGQFVRKIDDPRSWGRIAGTSELPGRWIFEYASGARVTIDGERLESFVPAPHQRKMVEQKRGTAFSGSITPSFMWPERAA